MGFLQAIFGRRERSAVVSPGAGAPAAATAADAGQAWRKSGNEAVAGGNYAEAARCFEEGVAAVPADASLRLNLGFVLK